MDLVIRRVAPNWESLGLYLIPHHEVSIIEVDHKSKGVVVCCRKALSKWLERDPQASWGQLVEALKKIDHDYLASKLEHWLLPSHGEPPL